MRKPFDWTKILSLTILLAYLTTLDFNNLKPRDYIAILVIIVIIIIFIKQKIDEKKDKK